MFVLINFNVYFQLYIALSGLHTANLQINWIKLQLILWPVHTTTDFRTQMNGLAIHTGKQAQKFP